MIIFTPYITVSNYYATWAKTKMIRGKVMDGIEDAQHMVIVQTDYTHGSFRAELRLV